MDQTEKADHQLLFSCCFEGFLLSSPPEFPNANVAGAKLEIFLFLGLSLSVHQTSEAGEHSRG